MATPQGMSRGSRDLGPLPPGAQEGLQGDIPPGFTYTQIESMVRELRTAAALEVNLQTLQSSMDSLHFHACSTDPVVTPLVYHVQSITQTVAS